MTLDLGNMEEDIKFVVKKTADDGKDSNPHGRSLSAGGALKNKNRLLLIRTWNSRKLYQALKEMENTKLDVLAISECKWTDNGRIMKDDHFMLYFRGREHKNGVGIIKRKEIGRSVLEYWSISERVIMLKLQVKPFNIIIIQVYFPTQDHEDEEIEVFYDEI